MYLVSTAKGFQPALNSNRSHSTVLPWMKSLMLMGRFIRTFPFRCSGDDRVVGARVCRFVDPSLPGCGLNLGRGAGTCTKNVARAGWKALAPAAQKHLPERFKWAPD